MTSFEHLKEKAKKDSKDSEELFGQIGRVIAMWGDIDDWIYEIFKKAVKTNERTASVIYYRNRSISDRIVLTDKLVEINFVEESKKTWKSLSTELKNRINFRNEIAHNPVMDTVVFDPDLSNFRVKFQSQASKNKDKATFKAGIDEIDEHIRAVIPTYIRLRSFAGSKTNWLSDALSEPRQPKAEDDDAVPEDA